MNWKNLAKNKCPKCDSDFTENMQVRDTINYKDEPIRLMIHLCGFRISEQKFKEIVSGIVSKGLARQSTEVIK